MPISDDALQKEKNRFIAVTSDAKFGQAIAALTSFDGEPWWHLVVRMDDGSWRVAKFSDLRESLANTPNAADLRLGDAAELSAVNAVDRYTVSFTLKEPFASFPVNLVMGIVQAGSGLANARQPIRCPGNCTSAWESRA